MIKDRIAVLRERLAADNAKMRQSRARVPKAQAHRIFLRIS
jgi:hypothetical protein